MSLSYNWLTPVCVSVGCVLLTIAFRHIVSSYCVNVRLISIVLNTQSQNNTCILAYRRGCCESVSSRTLLTVMYFAIACGKRNIMSRLCRYPWRVLIHLLWKKCLLYHMFV